MNRYVRLKCIRTAHGKGGGKSARSQRGKKAKEFVVGLRTFYEAVRAALGDPEVELIPIVSIKSGKRRIDRVKLEDFSVDYLLPVQVQGGWVGVAYRNGQPAMALMDRYDITNKAILCDAAFDIHSLKGFTSRYDRLRVVDDDESAHR